MKTFWKLFLLTFLPGCAGTLYINGTDGVKEIVRYGTIGEAVLVIRNNVPGVKVQVDIRDITITRDGEGKIILRYPYAGLLGCGDQIETSIVVTAPGLRVGGEIVHGVVRTWIISGSCGYGMPRRSTAWLLELEGNYLRLRDW